MSLLEVLSFPETQQSLNILNTAKRMYQSIDNSIWKTDLG